MKPTGAAGTPDGRERTNRTEGLSDGVFAIAMTLLVLDLRVPSHQAGTLLASLLAQWPAYIAFLASFSYIAVVWTNHHATFRQIDAVDRVVSSANLGILLGTVLLPFPTAVLTDAFRSGSRVDEQTALVLYAAVAASMSAAWLVLFLFLERRSAVTSRATASASWKAQARRPIFGTAGYALGALAGVTLLPVVGLIAFVLVPLYYAATSEGLRAERRHRRSSARWRSADRPMVRRRREL
ncbi:MAG: hypothetical protein JWQ18_1982 [Conexibacter sp.]|nr:hypothetical protein [Conexibacter sp.]